MTAAQKYNHRFDLDIVAFSESGDALLVGEVKKIRPEKQPWKEPVLQQLVSNARELNAPYMMTVDLDRIRIFDAKKSIALPPLLDVSTDWVLRHYDDKVDWELAHPQYLELLVHSWLLDVALGREKPVPELDRLKEIGLAKALSRGDVVAAWRGFF